MEKMMFKCGFININKPTAETSSNVVCKLKKILGKVKVGHLGTLDPAASGVLPIAFGKATKFFDYFLTKNKEYVAVVKFGIETDTLDSFGKIINTNKKLVSRQEIEAVLDRFKGKISQIPPKYSAIKIGGKKACDLAREGKEIEIKPREIEIFDIKLMSEEAENVFRFKVFCSAGTYIRTLFNDIARELGTVATTMVIIRTKSGLFDIEKAITIDEFKKENTYSTIEEIFDGFKVFEIDNPVIEKKILNGVKLEKTEIKIDCEDRFFIKIKNQLAGMYHFEENKLICDVFLAE